MRIEHRRRADIVAVMGATGSGKSASIRAALAADESRRRLIYDPGEDYSAFGRVTHDPAELIRRVKAAREGGFSLVFRPSYDLDRARRQFDFFCRLAFSLGDVLVVTDELEDVTLPNWSPPGWSVLIRKGRKHGIRIIAASQRPAGVEKRLWSMATVVRCGRLNHADDARTVAAVLMVEHQELVALPPLAWIQRSIYKPAIVRGRLDWRRGQPVEVIESETPLPGSL